MQQNEVRFAASEVGRFVSKDVPKFNQPFAGSLRWRICQRMMFVGFQCAAIVVISVVTLTAFADDNASKNSSKGNKSTATKGTTGRGKKTIQSSPSLNSVTDSNAKKSDGDGKEESDDSGPDDSKRPPKIIKSDAEWKKILKPEQFRVTRLKETELPFSGKYWHFKKPGKYVCVCCGEELYSSTEKFDSGTGWPSFWAPVSRTAVGTETDNSLETPRTEAHCDRCGAHLGHIFDDGPAPTGMRHCINSVSLKFVPAESEKSK